MKLRLIDHFRSFRVHCIVSAGWVKSKTSLPSPKTLELGCSSSLQSVTHIATPANLPQWDYWEAPAWRRGGMMFGAFRNAQSDLSTSASFYSPHPSRDHLSPSLYYIFG